MRKRHRGNITRLFLIPAFVIVCLHCNDEMNITGITQTDATGEIIGEPDDNDWCPPEYSDTEIGLPETNGMYPAYPNPAEVSVMIQYLIIQPGHVKLEVMDNDENIIRKLVDAFRYAGEHVVLWQLDDENGKRVKPGYYRVTYYVNDEKICAGDIKVLKQK